MRIKDRLWKIKYDKEKTNKEEACGLTCYKNQTIYISPDLHKEMETVTILHEITHAYVESYGFGEFETLNEEQLCEFIGNYIFDILETYKQAIKELKGDK